MDTKTRCVMLLPDARSMYVLVNVGTNLIQEYFEKSRRKSNFRIYGQFCLHIFLTSIYTGNNCDDAYLNASCRYFK